MGWKYEVEGRFRKAVSRDGYEDKDVYRGSSLIIALYSMWSVRKESSCTRLTIR